MWRGSLKHKNIQTDKSTYNREKKKTKSERGIKVAV
jgi:hypothetical protein